MDELEVFRKAQLVASVAGAEAYNDKRAPELSLKPSTRLYRRRWVTLAFFCLLSMSNSFSWIQYSTISNVIVEYYHVSYTTVDWTSMIYMVTYIPLIMPATWFQEKYGLRFGLILGAFGNALGAWIKCFSTNRNQFVVSFFGQTVMAMSQVFILSVPSKLAAVWFGYNEVSLATAIGVFGNQLGIAFGFWIPTLLVPHSEDATLVGCGLMTLFLISAVLTSVAFLLILFGVPEKPQIMPSIAQCIVAKSAAQGHPFTVAMKTVLLNGSFLKLLLAYGINVGCFYAISTLLNQTLLPSLPDKEKQFGLVGFVIILAGMFGSLVCGWWLNRTKRFKVVNIVVCLISLIGMVDYVISIERKSMISVFTAAFILGFSLSGYLPIGLEFAAEITFPCSEAISSSLMNASAQILGIIITSLCGYILQSVSNLISNVTLTAALFMSLLLTGIIAPEYKRHNAGLRKTSTTENFAEKIHNDGDCLDSSVVVQPPR